MLPDRDVDVDIARPVERVEHQQVLAAGVGGRDLVRPIHLLRSHAGQMTRPLGRADEDLIADDIERLLHFALHVDLRVRLRGGDELTAHRVAQLAEGHGARDRLGRERDVEDQRVERAARLRKAAALFDQVLRQRPSIG